MSLSTPPPLAEATADAAHFGKKWSVIEYSGVWSDQVWGQAWVPGVSARYILRRLGLVSNLARPVRAAGCVSDWACQETFAWP
ncbi:hypothetical protein EBU95_19105 [bacterium]|nr:hypothetical protein [bacterium]